MTRFELNEAFLAAMAGGIGALIGLILQFGFGIG